MTIKYGRTYLHQYFNVPSLTNLSPGLELRLVAIRIPCIDEATLMAPTFSPNQETSSLMPHVRHLTRSSCGSHDEKA